MRNKSTYLLVIIIAAAMVLQSCGNKNTARGTVNADTLGVLSNLDLLIEEDSKNPELYYERAQYHLTEQNIFSGLRDIESAIGLDTTKAKYYLLYSDFNLLLNKIPEVRTNISNALRLEPNNTDALLKYAEFQLYLKEYDDVFENVNKALRENKYLAKGYFLKGMAYIERKDTALAISSFQTCIEQDADYYHAHMQLGLIFAAKHDPICITYYNNAIRVNYEKPEAYYALAYFLQEHGSYEDALLTYDKMLAVSPKNAAAFYNKGYIYMVYLQKYDEAIEWFTQAIKSDYRYADAFYNRGRSYELKGNKTAARQDFENALKTNEEHELSKAGLKRLGN